MGYADAMRAAARGEAAEFLPFAPRLDIWYRSNRIRGTLPAKYKNASLIDVIDDLGVGFNTMIPDFLDCTDESDYIHRGLGIMTGATSNAHIIKLHNVDYTAEELPQGLKVTYRRL